MSTFEQSRKQFNQTHFTIIEIDIPVVTGACTIGTAAGFGTPKSCDQPSDAIKTYKFTGIDAPLNMPESGILRVVKSVSETPAKLNIDKGLASRGTGSVVFLDVTGVDPNPNAPAVNDEVKNQGTFFSKLNIRNELTNKVLRVKNYRLEIDGSIDLENGAETRNYIIESVDVTKNGEWSFKFKDELSKINIGDSVWPLPLEGSLRGDIDSTQVIFPVDATVIYKVGDTIRISEELCKIVSVTDIGTATAKIEVQARGLPISYTQQLTRTVKDEHSIGDEIFVCEVSDEARIDGLLRYILLDIGIDDSFIPIDDWIAEVDLWHATTRINTIWYESKPTADVLKEILTNFMIDLWFDPVVSEAYPNGKIKLSAVSVWKQSEAVISEGNEINFESVTKKRNESLRSTRAISVYNKPFLTGSDDVTSFSKASIFKREELETDDLFGEPKLKTFEFTNLLSDNAADLLVNRWVNRFINPYDYTFKTPESKLDFSVGSVVDASILADVGFDGLNTNISRMQITSIKPNYTKHGRDYTVTALSYEPIFLDGSETIIPSGVYTGNIDLYTQAGNPPEAVTTTFIFDGTIMVGSSNTTPTIALGGFKTGSVVNIILANGANLMGKGGDGGNGGGATFDPERGGSYYYSPQPTNGESGGTVIDAQGVECNIYLSGAAPSTTYPIALGTIKAPSGGAGGFDVSVADFIAGDGGNGGDGNGVGVGGTGGKFKIVGVHTPIDVGTNGTTGTSGASGVYGIAGANNNATGGLAGSGVIDGGVGNVTLHGETSANYINGNGDHSV